MDQEPDRPPPQQREVHTTQEAGSGHQRVSVVALYSGAAGDQHWAPAEGSDAPRSSGDLWDRNAIGTAPPSDDFTLAPQRPPPIHKVSINTTHFSGGTNIENNGVLNLQLPPTPPGPVPAPSQLQQHAAPNAIHTSAAVDNQGLCMPGTRTFTLDRLQSLATSVESDDPDVIWMHGPAGAGKSAIMRTMANALSEQGVLLGSFFFLRSDSERNTSASFIPTLALQSFTSLPATQSHIQNAIHSHPTIFSQSIPHQLRRLVETPLKLAAGHQPKWTTQSPLVIVIDGLDECAEASRQVEIIKAVYQLASTIHSSTDRRVKVLVASRPERAIKGEFERNRESTTIFELDPSDANIELYYDTQLDQIRRDNNLPESWPSPKQIEWLKEKTSGQYSFAHISMGFLADGDPVERLKMLETRVVTHGLEPFEALDALYATVFRQIPPEMADKALLLVRLSLFDSQFAERDYDDVVEHVLSLPSGFISRLLPFISSIFYFDEGTYRPYHASLGDFLGDPLRSAKYSLFLDVRELSGIVVDGLLNIHKQIRPPIDEETSRAWFEFYRQLYLFVSICSFFSQYILLPTMAASLDQLSLSLPTMDLCAFGHCNFLLFILSNHLQKQRHPLAADPSHLRTIRSLLDQIHSIQRLRFAKYEAIEAGGDSGLGLFGLLLVFASLQEFERSDISRQCRLESIVGHLTRAHGDTPDTEQNAEEPVSLCTLVHQLSTFRKMVHSKEFLFFYPTFVFTGVWGLLSPDMDSNPPQIWDCLPRTLDMILDLPSQGTRIQRLISEFISCQNHPTLHRFCRHCTNNLKQSQLSVVIGVMRFLEVSKDWCFGSPRTRALAWGIGARFFTPCYNALGLSPLRYYFDGRRYKVYTHLGHIGEEILWEVMQGEPEGVDTPTSDELRKMLSRLHREQRNHDTYYDCRIPFYFCWVCNDVDPGDPKWQYKNTSSSDGESD